MEDDLHRLFVFSSVIKAVHGALEIIGAGVLFFFGYFSGFLKRLFASELVEDPRDIIANSIINISSNPDARIFWVFYLLVHGIINFGISIALIKKKLWAYPAAGIILILFIAYQIYKLSFGFSVFLFVITIVDVILILLLHREYRLAVLRRKN